LLRAPRRQGRGRGTARREPSCLFPVLLPGGPPGEGWWEPLCSSPGWPRRDGRALPGRGPVRPVGCGSLRQRADPGWRRRGPLPSGWWRGLEILLLIESGNSLSERGEARFLCISHVGGLSGGRRKSQLLARLGWSDVNTGRRASTVPRRTVRTGWQDGADDSLRRWPALGFGTVTT
jgi:hypothetical protein